MNRLRIPSSSTPLNPRKQMELQRNESPIETTQKVANIKKTTVLEMVVEAITAIGLPRKGASYPAIKKWIMANKEVDPARLKYSLKIALQKGVDQGILVKPLKTASIRGAIGHFMLPKNPKTSVKKPAMPLKKTMSLKTNKVAPKTKTGKKTTEKLTSPTKDKNIVSNPSKPSKVPVVKKKTATTTQQKAKAEKKSVTKVNSNGKTGKKTAVKVSSKSEAEKKPAAKVSLKGKAGKKLATKVPLKAKAGKKVATKVPLKAKAGKKLATKVPLKAKAGSEVKYLFSDSDENEINEDVISSAPEKEKFEDQAKNNTVTVTEKFKEQPAMKDKKRRVVKATKNLSSDKTSQAKSTRKVDNKKLYVSNKAELARQELSDTEINLKKKSLNVLKSCSSDTELEVSKKEAKTKREIKKLPIRAKRNASKI